MHHPDQLHQIVDLERRATAADADRRRTGADRTSRRRADRSPRRPGQPTRRANRRRNADITAPRPTAPRPTHPGPTRPGPERSGPARPGPVARREQGGQP